MDSLLKDIRYSIRVLLKNPAFAIIATVSLALGISANSAIFSIMDKLLVRSLPVKAPEQIVLLSAESINPRFLNQLFSYPDFVDYRDHNQVLSGLIAFITAEARIGTAEETDRVSVEIVSGNYFDALGVPAVKGRTFLPEEDRTPGTHAVVVLSHGTWQRRFSSDPNIVGKLVVLNNSSYTVVGVAPKGFTGMRVEFPSELWVPAMMRSQLIPGTIPVLNRRFAWLRLAGRLKPNVSIEQAQASLDVLARQVREAHTASGDRHLPFYERRMLLEPGGKGISFLRRELNRTLKLLMAVVGLLLLIACANVATLLLARSAVRRKEIAVRLALGASRGRLVRQLLTESLLLSVVGAGTGLLLVPWWNDLLLAFQRNINLRQTSLGESVDTRVLGFTIVVSVLCSAIFGLAPALQSSRSELVPALKDSEFFSGRREWRWSLRNLLVVAQVALALLMLIGAGLFVKSLRNLFAIDPGFRTEKILLVPIELPRQRYSGGKANQFFRQLSERLKALPGVEAVATASITPLSGSVGNMSVIIEGYQAKPNENVGIDYNQVGPGYHDLMGIPIVQGRGFTEQDKEGAPGVIVINEALARLYFPNQNPIGKRVSSGPGNPWWQIIGVTRDFKTQHLTEVPIPHLDLPALQHPYGNFARVLIRATAEPAKLLPAVQQEVKAVDRSATIVGASTVSEEFNNSIAPARMATILTSLFGLLALLLASVGLYGVMVYSVTRRTREIGIRMALGAQRWEVLGLVLRDGIAIVGLGVALGMASAFAATRLIVSQLYGVSATDPRTFVAVSLILTGVALLASYLPARRATRIDPMAALRYE
ncbi:MAG TPA: ABC transporter permease [Acidobacteriota bacterium]|jgi:predicted permease|nr:ABC transporter permease [Acidobacteriota bacterium]